MHHPILSNLLVSLAITLSALPATRASCYYPDGSFPTDYIYEPCEGDGFSTCCIPSEGDSCMSNGLCNWVGAAQIFRGACTDKTWNSPNCFQHCKGGADAGTFQRVISCGGNSYCCYDPNSICCNDDTQVFQLAQGSGTVVNDYTRITPTGSLATAAPTAAVTESGSASAVITGIAYSTNAAIGFQTSTTRSNTQTALPTASSTSTTLNNDKIPIIAGIAGGVAIIFGLLVGYRCAKRRTQRKNAMPPVLPFNPPPPAYNPRQTPVSPSPRAVSPSPRAVSPVSSPQWKNDPADMQPWAAITPMQSLQSQPWRTPELDSQVVQGPPHGGVVYEALGTPAQSRHEVPGQTREMYEAP